MTGTAMTEEEEFRHTYGFDVIEIPTNKPVIREDKTDKVYFTRAGKLKGVVNRVKEIHATGQPILIGTVSVEKSEELSKLLTKEGIAHSVLNAKNHKNEAKIVAQAGQFGKVTVATNMAGRGTDIALGGNVDFKVKEELHRLGYSDELIADANTFTTTDDEQIIGVRKKYKEIEKDVAKDTEKWAERVKEAGGLYILGTERHDSRRIDNQLRGRSGRQGDPGTSEFLISLEDDLMRLFGGNKVLEVLGKPSEGEEDYPLDIKMLSNGVEKAQKQVETSNFEVRKSLMDYDGVVNNQREIIYKQRDAVLEQENTIEVMNKLIKEFITNNIKDIVEGKKITLANQDTILAEFSEIEGLNNLPHYTEEELNRKTVEDVIVPLVK